LDVRHGEWVAARQEPDLPHGYRLSQLFSLSVDAASLAEDYYTTRYPEVFYNLRIGVAWIAASERLTATDVLRWCGESAIASGDPGPCTMGVDQGKDLHVVISRWSEVADLRLILYLGVHRDWEELDPLMAKFHVNRAVVDALPEQRNARAFALRHSGKVWLNTYAEHQAGRPAWNDTDYTVKENRTESLDASRACFRDTNPVRAVLPRPFDVVQEFAQHMAALLRKREEKADGSARYVYVEESARPDHFAHAWNYDCLCWLPDMTPARAFAPPLSMATVGPSKIVQVDTTRGGTPGIVTVTNPAHPDYRPMRRRWG